MAKIPPIRENTDFRRAYHRGKFAAHPCLVTHCVRNRVGCVRVGITVSKKLGSAPQRSRARRVIRAAWRQHFPAGFPQAGQALQRGVDIVFVAREGTAAMKSAALAPIMRGQLRKLGFME